MTDRYIPRRALTREEISKLTSDELNSRLSVQQRKDIVNMTSATFDQSLPKKLETESTGEYLQRQRKSKSVNKAEFARLIRINTEAFLYNTKDQRQKRVVDNLSANITAESVAENEEAEKQRKERERLEDLESGGSGVRPMGYGPGGVREVDDDGKKK